MKNLIKESAIKGFIGVPVFLVSAIVGIRVLNTINETIIGISKKITK